MNISSIPIPISKYGMTKIKEQPLYPIIAKNPKPLSIPNKADIIPAIGNKIPGDVIQVVLKDIKAIAKNIIKIKVQEINVVSSCAFASISMSKD